jgi:hypothetical protein
MPRGATTGDDERDEPKGGRPGPVDHGGQGGMATREHVPELTTPDESEDPRPRRADGCPSEATPPQSG